MSSKRPSKNCCWQFMIILGLSLGTVSIVPRDVQAQCQGCGNCLYCIEGKCIPNRVTYGFYQTHWRRWPCDPRHGVSGGRGSQSHGLPNTEVPEKKEETSVRPDFSSQGSVGSPTAGVFRNSRHGDSRNNPFAHGLMPYRQPLLKNGPRGQAQPGMTISSRAMPSNDAAAASLPRQSNAPMARSRLLPGQSAALTGPSSLPSNPSTPTSNGQVAVRTNANRTMQGLPRVPVAAETGRSMTPAGSNQPRGTSFVVTDAPTQAGRGRAGQVTSSTAANPFRQIATPQRRTAVPSLPQVGNPLRHELQSLGGQTPAASTLSSRSSRSSNAVRPATALLPISDARREGNPLR